MKRGTIYVDFLDDGVNAWRRVEAERRHDGLYRILTRPPDAGEAWTSPLGSVVRCEHKVFSGGAIGLVAREKVG